MSAARAGVLAEHGVTLARAAHDRYRLDELDELDGRETGAAGALDLADIRVARAVAHRLNASRSAGRAIPASELAAFGLLDEVLRAVIEAYREEIDGTAFERAAREVRARVGARRAQRTLSAWQETFAPQADDQATLEELVLTWLGNANPAAAQLRELVDDRPLARAAPYPDTIEAVRSWSAEAPGIGPEKRPLIELLRAPALASPDSLAGQLRFVLDHWADLLGDRLAARLGALRDRLLGGLDLIAEEERATFMRFAGAGVDGAGGDAAGAHGFTALGADAEVERFSADVEWMPRVVLMAKSTYVWLDQLSRQYGRDIQSLDAVPDEELDRLARFGITGLWLIGLWERSRASERIKRMRGQPDAVASAYSLDDYAIAADLGGTEAHANLAGRAWQRGIRVASDMVPNHMGIDSQWVIQHPDWFLSLPYPPYPAYTFNGPDLSSDERVGIFLEDHYWDGSDAAVVFKRHDRWTGDERSIYHGNDGTSFPWNDTAQLDYLKAEVREAVIQTILHVARQFPIIRFDAAMVLAKKHIQRLWWPPPGSAGGIPSRAEHSMSPEEFDRRMPTEFWREVVDRVAVEAPGTLLLAEAFWLLEGYFVRTLGMHRVYNSAFMVMLRDERNAEYRLVMRNTLEFDPEILKRYVNFMSNPDEKTAVEQFGKGDKYFGVCTLLVTLPGLPMFGHGQIEGFAEKYGMEFRRAAWDERPDGWLIERHDREIVPLLHRRAQFAEVRDFLLYDFEVDGGVNEDVFAYSNVGPGGDRSLVVYHNRYAETSGWVRESVAYAIKSGGDKIMVRRGLSDGLRLSGDGDLFVVFREARTGQEFIRSAAELRERGLFVQLAAYSCVVFLDWREIHDGTAHLYRRLAERLAGRGVGSIEETIRELELEPVHGPIRRLLLASAGEVRGMALDLIAALRDATGAHRGRPDAEIAELIAARCQKLESLASASPPPIGGGLAEGSTARAAALGWSVLGSIGSIGDAPDSRATSRAWLEELRLGPVLANGFRELGLDEGPAWTAVSRVRVLLALEPSSASRFGAPAIRRLLEGWFGDPDLRGFLGVNRSDGVTWFNKESFEELTWWWLVLTAVDGPAAALLPARRLVDRLLAAAAESSYQVDRLIALAALPRRGMVRPRRQREAKPASARRRKR
jgi:glycosidase